MKIKEISYLDPRVDLENDCLDVFVTLENDVCYLIEVTTPKFFYTLMEKFKNDFVPAGYPYIIVSKLTDEVIQAAIQEFIDAKEDSYWLKLYHMTATLKIEDINEILDRKKKGRYRIRSKNRCRNRRRIDQTKYLLFYSFKLSVKTGIAGFIF